MTVKFFGKTALSVAAATLLCGAAPADQPQPVTIAMQGLRSTKGDVLVCMTRLPQHFPDCRDDPDKRHFTIAPTGDATSLGKVVPGDYAIAIIHDENSNGKLDTFAAIPREGVGFSRNPALRFGAPSFDSARFTVSGAPVEQDIRLKYFL